MLEAVYLNFLTSVFYTTQRWFKMQLSGLLSSDETTLNSPKMQRFSEYQKVHIDIQ